MDVLRRWRQRYLPDATIVKHRVFEDQRKFQTKQWLPHWYWLCYGTGECHSRKPLNRGTDDCTLTLCLIFFSRLGTGRWLSQGLSGPLPGLNIIVKVLVRSPRYVEAAHESRGRLPWPCVYSFKFCPRVTDNLSLLHFPTSAPLPAWWGCVSCFSQGIAAFFCSNGRVGRSTVNMARFLHVIILS